MITKEQFWENTWNAWRSGRLPDVNADFREEHLSPEFSDFRTNMSIKFESLDHFLDQKGLSEGEFLINFGDKDDSDEVQNVLTSKSYYFDLCEKQPRYYELADIAEYKVKAGWIKTQYTVRLHDGSEETNSYTAPLTPDALVYFAIELSKKGEHSELAGNQLNNKVPDKQHKKENSDKNIGTTLIWALMIGCCLVILWAVDGMSKQTSNLSIMMSIAAIGGAAYVIKICIELLRN